MVSDLAAVPLPDASFDVVICTDVLEHVLKPREAVEEIGRLLKRLGGFRMFFLLKKPFV